jgi:hypothetical protein
MGSQNDWCYVWSEFRELLIKEYGRHLEKQKKAEVMNIYSFVQACGFQTVYYSNVEQGS